MARRGLSQKMKQQVLEMTKQGVPIRKIAHALGVSRNTVRRLLREQDEVSIDAHADLGLVDDQTEARFQDLIRSRPWLSRLNYREIVLKRKRGRSYDVLYKEYGPDISYPAFVKAIRALCEVSVLKKTVASSQVTMRLDHVAGEKTFVDYADGIPIYDRASGEISAKTQLFCGVLGFSSLTFAEFTLSQKLESFIASHENMWAYFGGVTPYVVVDNLKSGVSKAHLYDPDVNPTYCDYANARGFSVLPARPVHPKDKACVEAAIGVIQRSFYQQVAERRFYSIGELNHTFRSYLDRLNLNVMKDHGVSRRERFEEERHLLKPLPCEAYEISEWKEAILHADCHVQIQHNFYSAPFTYIGRKLRVRIRQKLIEIFSPEGQSLAVHVRASGRGRRLTIDAHYPDYKRQLGSFDIAINKKTAVEIGPKTAELVERMFDIERPLKSLRPVQGIIRLYRSGAFAKEAMEYAAAQALTYRRYRVAYIKDCAKFFAANPRKVTLVAPSRESDHLHLHHIEP